MDENVILFSYETRVNFITFWSILGINVLIFIAYLAIRHFRIDWRVIIKLVFVEYIISVILLTVVFREPPVYPEGFQNSILADKTMLSGNLLLERIFNILLFLPVGALLYLLLKSHKLLYTILLGFVVSITIELMQYVFNKGVADIEDVICNVIGLTFGTVISMIIIKLIK